MANFQPDVLNPRALILQVFTVSCIDANYKRKTV